MPIRTQDLLASRERTLESSSRDQCVFVPNHKSGTHRFLSKHLANSAGYGGGHSFLDSTLSQSDLAFRGLLSVSEKAIVITVEEVGSIQPVVVDADVALDHAAEMMNRHHIDHLPVVKGECLVGMLSSRDLVGVVPAITPRKKRCERPERPLDRDHRVKVGDVASPQVHAVSCDMTIQRAAWLMVRHKISSLPIVRDNRIVGILTDTDLLRAFMDGIPRIQGPDPTNAWRHCAVADFMNTPVWTVEPKSSVLHAWLLMREHGVRHLAVVQDGPLALVAGIVSEEDVYYALRESRTGGDSPQPQECLPRISLADIMTHDVMTIGKYENLVHAAAKMLAHDISALLVMDSGLEGIITRSDLLKAMVKAG